MRIERGHIQAKPTKESSRTKGNANINFRNYLYEEIKKNDTIKISAHAQQRIKERQIDFGEGDMKAIKDAITELEKKGARESLILYGDMALIASIKNRTIITAMDQCNMEVVTNIDSALVLK